MYNMDKLIDKRFGIIKSIRNVKLYNDTNFITYTAESNRISDYLNWRPDHVGSGTSVYKEKAYYAAIGELIERYCGNYIPEGLEVYSESELDNVTFLSVESFMKYSNEQYKIPGFPFKKPSNVEKIEWVRGRSLFDNSEILIPAKFVYLNYWMYKKNELQVRQNPILLSGIASGPDVDFALTSAILEIIERDTTMLWWLGNQNQTEIKVSKKDLLCKSILDSLPDGMCLKWLLLPSSFSTYTVAAVLIDSINEIFTVGFATRLSAQEAMEKSAAEAQQLRMVSLDMLIKDSSVWKNIDNKDYLGLKDYREDRSYRYSFRDDWSDMISLKHNVQYFLDTEVWEHAYGRLSKSNSSIFLSELMDFKLENKVNYLVKEFKKNNMSLYMVELTTPDVKKSGQCVVRVISSEACPNMPTALPMLENERLKKVIQGQASLGIERDLSPLPHS